MNDDTKRKPPASYEQLKAALPVLVYGMLLVNETQIGKSGKPYRKVSLKVEVWPPGYKELLDGTIVWTLFQSQCVDIGDQLAAFHKISGWVMVAGTHPGKPWTDRDGLEHTDMEAKRFGFQFWTDVPNFEAELAPLYEELSRLKEEMDILKNHTSPSTLPNDDYSDFV